MLDCTALHIKVLHTTSLMYGFVGMQLSDLMQYEPYANTFNTAKEKMAEKGMRPAGGEDPQANSVGACPDMDEMQRFLTSFLHKGSPDSLLWWSVGCFQFSTLCRGDEIRLVNLADFPPPYNIKQLGRPHLAA